MLKIHKGILKKLKVQQKIITLGYITKLFYICIKKNLKMECDVMKN